MGVKVWKNSSVTTILLLVLFFSVLVFAAPSISIISDTPANGTTTGDNSSVFVNYTVSESNLANISFSWNGSNYSYYDEELVLMMNLNNVSGLGENSSFIVDHSSFANNGTYNDSIIDCGYSHQGCALNFTGSEYVNVSYDSSLVLGSEFSFVAWIYPTNHDSNYNMIVSMDNAGAAGSSSYDFGLKNGKPYLAISDGAWAEYVGDKNLSKDSSWYHFAAVRNSSDVLNFYIDGKLNKSFSSVKDPQASVMDVILGARMGNSLYFTGAVDDLFIFNRSLSSSEVYQQYVSNFSKTSTSSWSLSIDQSQNATDALVDGTYDYQLFAADSSSGLGSSAVRTITIDDANYLNSCTNITTSGDYYLDSNITDSDFRFCMSFSANDSSLDCQGNTIDGDISNSSTKNAVYISGVNNVTVNNCVFSDWVNDEAISSNQSSTVNISLVTCNDNENCVDVSQGQFITLQNIFSNGSQFDDYDLSFLNHSDFDTVESNISEGDGISIAFANNFTLTNFYGLDPDDDGIDIEDSTNVTVIYAFLDGTDFDSIEIDDSIGINVSYTNITDSNDDGIDIDDADNLMFDNLRILDSNDMGIDADNATNTNLTNSLIYNNTNDDGVYFYGGSHNLYLFNVNASNNGANGLLIKDTDNITIINSYTHENAGDGVDLQDSSEPVIILNLQSYSNADDGMYLESSNHVNITSSFFLNNTDDGVDQRYSNDTYYNGNVFLDNDDSGVAIINSTRVSFLNSTIESNLGSGFKGFELSNLTFANSTTIGNVIAGLHLIDNLEGNSFYNNVFNNTLNLNSSGNISFFNVSQSNEVNIISRVGFGGNYWSNYSSAGFSDGCTDANSDGICDSSFTIDGSNIDYFPLYMPVVSSTSSSGSLDTSGGGSGRCVNGWVKNSEGSGCIREADSTSLSSSENKGDDFGVSTLGSLEEGSSESSEDSHASGLAVDEELWAVKGLKDVYVFSGTLNAANLMWIIFGLLFMFILFIIIFGWREKKHKEEKKELKSLTKSHAKSRARQKAIWKKKKK